MAYERTSCRRQVAFMTGSAVIVLACGEGACPRWVAKRPRHFPGQTVQTGFATASQPNGGKPPRHNGPQSIEHEQRIIAELRLKPARGHRPPKQIPLNLIAPMLAQEVELLVGFHALGDHCRSEEHTSE